MKKSLICIFMILSLIFQFGCNINSSQKKPEKSSFSNHKSSSDFSSDYSSESSTSEQTSSVSGSSEISSSSSNEQSSSSEQTSSVSSSSEISSSSSNEQSSSSDKPLQKYSITFISEGSTGTAPIIEEKSCGESFVLPGNTFTKEFYTFIGWEYQDRLYKDGDTFTMPDNTVEFVAVWKSDYPGQPKFSAEEYKYDRIGGAPLELPYDADGAVIHSVYIDGQIIPEDSFIYNEKNCIEISEKIMIRLADGIHSVKTITDAGEALPAYCFVETKNSLKTEMLSEKNQIFNYGVDNGVSMNFVLNGVDVKSVYQGDYEIDKKYFYKNGNSITLSKDWLKRYCGKTDFEIVLTNNDVYSFSVNNNIIFYTDYDVTTIHNDTQSNIGHNPLFQYYDAVKIVSSPTQYGFESGKLLKITPNTTDVTYDCNGYFTTKTPTCDYMWYELPFSTAQRYRVSFDYATENTSTGEFALTGSGSSLSVPLLLGETNDNRVHHFETIVDGADLVNGIFIRAFFKGGKAGCIYIDNYSISEIKYNNIGSASISSTNNYVTNNTNSLTINGSFNNVSIVSIKRHGTNFWDDTYLNGFPAELDNFYNSSGYINLEHITSFTNSSLVFDKAFVEMVYGTETFDVTFSNGTVCQFSVTSNTLFYTNSNETNIFENLTGNIRSCQDTAMRQKTTYKGVNVIKYTPADATLSHAINYEGNNDNAIFTFSNNNLNHWWWEYDLPTTGRIFIKFNYELVTNGKQSHYAFRYCTQNGSSFDNNIEYLDGSGSYYKELDTSNLLAFSIYCPYCPLSEMQDTYMIIYSFSFGVCDSTAKSNSVTAESVSSVSDLSSVEQNVYMDNKTVLNNTLKLSLTNLNTSFYDERIDFSKQINQNNTSEVINNVCLYNKEEV